MSLTKKEIYDLNNSNVAFQNVQLGTLLSSDEQVLLTEKQVEDLNNENVTTQKVQFGKIIKAIGAQDVSDIEDLTEEEQEQLNNMDVSCQNISMGNYIQDIIDNKRVKEEQTQTVVIENNEEQNDGQK